MAPQKSPPFTGELVMESGTTPLLAAYVARPRPTTAVPRARPKPKSGRSFRRRRVTRRPRWRRLWRRGLEAVGFTATRTILTEARRVWRRRVRLRGVARGAARRV